MHGRASESCQRARAAGKLPTRLPLACVASVSPCATEELVSDLRCRLQQETAKRTTSEELLSRHRRQSAEVRRPTDTANGVNTVVLQHSTSAESARGVHTRLLHAAPCIRVFFKLTEAPSSLQATLSPGPSPPPTVGIRPSATLSLASISSNPTCSAAAGRPPDGEHGGGAGAAAGDEGRPGGATDGGARAAGGVPAPHARHETAVCAGPLG